MRLTGLITMLWVKRDFFPDSHFEYFCPTFPSVFTSFSASNSRVSEVSKIVITFFMMSEARWREVENVVFFRLPVRNQKNVNVHVCDFESRYLKNQSAHEGH